MAGLAEAGGKPLDEMTVDEARAVPPALSELSGPGPAMHRVWDETVETADGYSIGVRVLLPTASPLAVLAYYHGGGWVIGAIDHFETLGREIAARTGAAVVLMDYRLAPEYPYPTAVEDAWTGLKWVAAHTADIAGASVPIVVAGDSAGGTLAAVVAQRATAEGGPEIALQVLVYPITDGAMDTDSYADPECQQLVDAAAMAWFWDRYAPDPASRLNPDASPLRAANFAGLPPAVVLIAEHDPLRDEGEAYAAKLRAAGVPVESRRFLGQMHGFFQLVNVLPGSVDGLEYVAEHVNARLGTVAN
jgi:acetyl esterase